MLDLNGETKLAGLLGYPVEHSLSPVIHNAGFAARRLNIAYVPFSVEKPGAALKSSLSSIENLCGVSVTIPHKAWAARAADRQDALSQICGAANTLVRETDGSLSAYNTDGPGALEALARQGNPRGKRYLILGYGGAAAAIAHALLLDGNPAAVMIQGRNKTKRRRFVDALRKNKGARRALVRGVEWNDLLPTDVDVIIHTTPLGMKGKPKELPLPAEFLDRAHTIFDIVYNPARTPLVDAATVRRSTIVPGYQMLLLQATLQFEKFTGQKAPEGAMEKALLAALRRL